MTLVAIYPCGFFDLRCERCYIDIITYVSLRHKCTSKIIMHLFLHIHVHMYLHNIYVMYITC